MVLDIFLRSNNLHYGANTKVNGCTFFFHIDLHFSIIAFIHWLTHIHRYFDFFFNHHFIRHIQSNDMTTLPHQFTEDEAVSPRSTAQIKNRTSFQLFWNHQATAKIPADSFSMHYCNKSGKTKVLRHNLRQCCCCTSCKHLGGLVSGLHMHSWPRVWRA